MTPTKWDKKLSTVTHKHPKHTSIDGIPLYLKYMMNTLMIWEEKGIMVLHKKS
jgi:hypothetical protein